MNIVGIDTSGPAASCAVLRDGIVAELVAMNRGLTHSETIMPALDAAYRAHGEEIEFMMIDLCGGGNDDPQDARALCAELGCAFAPLFDTDNSAATAYGVRAIPTTLLVAPDGELLETQVGTMSEAAVSQKIERLLSTIQ